MSTSISIPLKLYERLKKEGVDIEALVVDLLVERLNLNPDEATQIRLELAEKYLKEGVKLVDKDPVQASEKLYKAAEECIKAAATHLNLKDILARVRRRGRWVLADLEKAARAAGKKISEDIYIGWDRANYLHVWGFHEAKLDAEDVKARIPYIEKMVEKLKEELGKREHK
ncbi:MAG: hypothetical protein DRJ40_02685 [Thermoprotei archaeon]|nr:MAG: hypothetical protein DRJ40_02685 [Thermoprotei archaeon]